MNRYERLVMDAEPAPYWLAGAPAPRPPLPGGLSCDLAIVGGGFSGLWTAVIAKELYPERSVVLLEGSRVGWAASGRNGGFCEASLTHGEANGLARFRREFEVLQRLGIENLDAIEAAVRRYGIECDFERTGQLSVATSRYQVAELRSGFGEFLDEAAVRAEVRSPAYLAGLWDRDGCAMVHPAKLAWGLAAAAARLGVQIYEQTPVTGLSSSGDGVALRARSGFIVHAKRVALGTNAFPSLVRSLRLYTVPVYDYVLMTEPLTAGQLASIGWRNRQGIGDSGNQFHYYRLTADNRILFGGYDAIYHFGRAIRSSYDQRPATFAKLAAHFFDTFPSLEGLSFTHRWGGAIDTCSRFCAFFGTAHRGRVAYALGYTGLGVGATRFGARVMLDLLDGKRTELTSLDMVRRKPVPFPPEPLAYAGIQATRWSLARADRNDGKRNMWLRALDAVGMGYDS